MTFKQAKIHILYIKEKKNNIIKINKNNKKLKNIKIYLI